MSNTFILCGADKFNIENQLDVFYDSVINRLLPSFLSIEEEANSIEKNSLAAINNQNFNPNVDYECAMEDAYFDGVNHYLVQSQMRQSFLNISTLWLYHLFEQQLNNISLKTIEDFDYKRRNAIQRIENCLREKNLEDNPNWKIIYSELRLVANVLKHAEGSSKNQLKERRPDLFLASSVSIPLFEYEICISEKDFEKYYKAVQCFWADYFCKFPITEINTKCEAPST